MSKLSHPSRRKNTSLASRLREREDRRFLIILAIKMTINVFRVTLTDDLEERRIE